MNEQENNSHLIHLSELPNQRLFGVIALEVYSTVLILPPLTALC